MWILVVSILAKYGYAGGASMIQVGPFDSYAACAKAGEVIQKQHGGSERTMNSDVKWSCVKK